MIMSAPLPAYWPAFSLEWLDLTSLLLPIRRTTIMQAAPGQQQDRRSSGSREWSGYCRRRRSQPGETLNLFV